MAQEANKSSFAKNKKVSEEDHKQFEAKMAGLGIVIDKETGEKLSLFENNLIMFARKSKREELKTLLSKVPGIDPTMLSVITEVLVDQFGDEIGQVKELQVKELEDAKIDWDKVVKELANSKVLDIHVHNGPPRSSDSLEEVLNSKGVSIVGSGRRKLIKHLFRAASHLNQRSKVFSSICTGIAGIGKSLMQRRMAKLLCEIFPDICILYVRMNAFGRCYYNLVRITRAVLKITKKSKILLFLDDTEDIFRIKDKSSGYFVTDLAILSDTETDDVGVQVFGSSRVLKDLISVNMSADLADKLGFYGYNINPIRIGESKLPLQRLMSPRDRQELLSLVTSIAAQHGKHLNEKDDFYVVSWLCGSVAKYIEFWLTKRMTKTEIVSEIWTKVKSNDVCLNYYKAIVEKVKLDEEVKSWQDLELFIKDNDMFEYIEKIEDKCQEENENLTNDQRLELLATGGAAYCSDACKIVPLYPIILLVVAVEECGGLLFVEERAKSDEEERKVNEVDRIENGVAEVVIAQT